MTRPRHHSERVDDVFSTGDLIGSSPKRRSNPDYASVDPDCGPEDFSRPKPDGVVLGCIVAVLVSLVLLFKVVW